MKIKILALTLSISLLLCACAQSTPPDDTDTDVSTESDTISDSLLPVETDKETTAAPETELPDEESPYVTLPPNVSDQGEVIYYHNFNDGLDEFYGSNATVELKKLGNDTVMYVSDRNAWWDGAKIKFETPILTPGETYLFSVEFMQDTEEEMKLAYNFGQKVNGEVDEDGIKGYKVKKDTWTTLQGIYTAKESTSDHLFIYEGSGKLNFYVRSVKIEHIKYDSSEACEYESLCGLAADHRFLFGSLLSQSTLSDPQRQNFFNKHFNIVSCGNYLFISKTKTREAADGMPHSNFEECDQYYEYTKAHGMKIRGHAIVPSGNVMDWFFRENYESDGAYVDKDTVLKRLDAYIGEIITHYETKYPGMTVSWDVVNKCTNGSRTIFSTSISAMKCGRSFTASRTNTRTRHCFTTTTVCLSVENAMIFAKLPTD